MFIREAIVGDWVQSILRGEPGRHARLAVALLALLVSAGARAAPAEVKPLRPVPSPDSGAMIDETPSLWYVELSGATTSEGGSEAALQSEHQVFRDEARRAGLSFRERRDFHSLFNGFSISVSPRDLGKLRQLSGVVAIHPVATIPASDAPSASPELFTALGMTGADVVQSVLGYSGKGIKVGIIDTGIDYDNADLGGDGVPRSNSPMFPNARVRGGWDFVGDAYNADPTSPTYNLTTTPDAYPDDCAGHGTHVAGIVGANGFVTGVAPQARLYAYRVFGCEGSTNDDIIIAAMERALAEGMDVVNMSLGSAFTWPQSPSAVAASRLARRGVVVVASIGNAGANGLYSGGAPGVGDDVIGVASFDNVGAYLDYFTASPDAARFSWLPAAAAPAAPTSGTFPLARTGTSTTTDDACAAPAPGSLAGQVALIRRGTCSFYQKASNAQNAGAVGVVLYNNTAGFLNPTVAGTPPITIPVVAIQAADGVTLDSRIAGGATSLTWTGQQGSFPNPTGDLISSFSSYGLTPDLDIKPDIGAPGGSVYSTFPLELGGHTTLSGTSMAAPHVAGAVALLLQARPHTSSRDVRDILQGAADPHAWWGNPGLGFLDNVSRQGAGMLRIDDAITSLVTVSPGKLPLGESQQGSARRWIHVENDGWKSVTYDLSFVNALSVAKTYTPAFYTSDATVTFDRPSVTVRGRGDALVGLTVNPPTAPDLAQYGGWVVLTPRDGGATKRIPFAGFVGDYQAIQVLAPTTYGFPWLAISYLGSFYGPVTGPADWIYTMAGEDVPNFLVHLDHQSRMLQIDIYDAASGKPKGQALSLDYMTRNTSSTGFFAFPWDGTVTRLGRTVTLPNGQYVARISILKALGFPFNPDSWERWDSPVIAIQR